MDLMESLRARNILLGLGYYLVEQDNFLSLLYPILFIVISILIISLITLYLLHYRKKPSSSSVARAIASYHLREMNFFKEFSDLRIATSYPLYDFSRTKITEYDVKISNSKGEDRGYLIVNVDREDFPILEFTTEGLSLTEMFRKKDRRINLRIIWFNPLYSIQMDENDKIVSSIGQKPMIIDEKDELKKKNDDNVFHKILWDAKITNREPYRKEVDSEWSFYEGMGGGKVSDLLQDEPTGGHSWFRVEGYERQPKYEQLDPGQGANHRDFKSGCGPTAWATIISWHNLLWTPELLRGSQKNNGIPWGNPSESAWDTYMDRVTVKLGNSTYLDVDDGGEDTGVVKDGDMSKGFDWMEDLLGHYAFNKKNNNNSIQDFWDAVSLHRRPAIVRVADDGMIDQFKGHYCVAVGLWYHPDKTDWIELNLGWGRNYSNKWIKRKYFRKFWFFEGINSPRIDYSESSSHSPVLCTTKGTSGLFDQLWMFWLGLDGKINYMTGSNGSTPNSSSKVTLDVTSIFPPAVTSDGYSIYLAYVDEHNSIKLKQWVDQYKGWRNLLFPSDIKTYVKPAINGKLGEWLTVAFSDNQLGLQVISTNKDCERPNAWPREIGYFQDDWYWTQVDALGTPHGLSLVNYKDYTVLNWVRSASYVGPDLGPLEIGGRLAFLLANPDGTVLGYVDKKYFTGTPALVVSNDTLFLADRGMDVEILTPIPPYETTFMGQPISVSASVGVKEIARLQETCIDNPTLGFMQLEQGNHPKLVVGWTGTDNSVNIRLLSVDHLVNMLNYSGEP